MGKLTIFQVILTGSASVPELPVAFAGQWMNGKVVVVLSEAMSMKGLYLQFLGRSEVQFKVGKTMRQSEEIYLNSLVVLKGHGPNESADNISLPAGTYEFPFNFQVPLSCPSSYEDILGFIRYQAKAIINKPWKFDHSTKTVFTVVGVCDLNLLSDALTPQSSKEEKTLRSIKCQTGIVTAWIKCDRKGYAPGETIVLSGEIINHSTRQIECSKVSMVAITTFIIDSINREDSRKIWNIQRDPIPPGGKDSFSNLATSIPAIPPSYLQGCNIINIRYFVRIKVKPSFASALKTGHEVIIGTVPLLNRAPHRPLTGPRSLPRAGVIVAQVDDVMADFAQMDFGENGGGEGRGGEGSGGEGRGGEGRGGGGHQQSSMQNPSTPSVPPSYQECVWGRSNTLDQEDNQHTRGDHHWAPSYPCYSDH